MKNFEIDFSEVENARIELVCVTFVARKVNSERKRLFLENYVLLFFFFLLISVRKNIKFLIFV